MKTIKLTKKELRALDIMLNLTPCQNGCEYPEMLSSTKNCYDCELTNSIESIKIKIGE